MGRSRLSADALKARRTYEGRRHADILDPGGEMVAERPPMPARPKLDYKPDIPIPFDDLIEANYEKTVVECVAEIPRELTKLYAEKWSWNASDELAVRNGCRFDLKRAMHFAYALRNNLTLWEGRWCGEPFVLRSWQPECFLRIFGWVRPHELLGWVPRFSKADVWTPKKSGKSPSGAAVAIYKWRYDGHWKEDANEPTVGGGQHVYCIASNGKQAGIVWGHACNMIHHSPVPKLEVDDATIKTNRQSSLLTYEPKLSKLTILTGDSPAALKHAEGLNAVCLIVDEKHVVDERTNEVTVDCGASQDAFLSFGISTYGSSGGFGKKDLDVGRDVERGAIEDDGFFFKTYEAPQDATDEDCGREEIWRLANPNLGYTVSSLQFKQSYERAKDDPGKFSGFKQRRLNIWQKASHPMLNYCWWERAGTEMSRDDYKSVGGGAGLDLAASEDWAAFALAWDDGEQLKCHVRLWTSESWIEENSHRDDFQKWRNDGHLVECEGDAIDFERVEADILDIMRFSRCLHLGYDKMFGMQMAQNLQKRLSSAKIWKFTQSIENYAVGSQQLKNALEHERFRHPNNPALNWQAGHVNSITRGDWEKPIKDDNMPWRKIDGIQALVMAIDVKRYAQAVSSPYVGVF